MSNRFIIIVIIITMHYMLLYAQDSDRNHKNHSDHVPHEDPANITTTVSPSTVSTGTSCSAMPLCLYWMGVSRVWVGGWNRCFYTWRGTGGAFLECEWVGGIGVFTPGEVLEGHF